MSEGLFTRVYLVLICINIALIVFGGMTIYKDANAGSGAQWNMSEGIVTSTADLDALQTTDVIWSWIMTAFNFVLLGGILGMLAQAGLPPEIQMMFGIPVTALAIFAIYPIIKAAAQVVGGAISGLLGIIARIV